MFSFSALVFALLAVLLLVCLFRAVSPVFSFKPMWQENVSLSRIARVSFFTLFQALASLFVALLVGLPMAFFCGRRNFFGKKFLLSLSSVPLCVPTLLVALGYITFFGNAGVLNRFFMSVLGLKKPPLSFLYSFFGLVVAQGFYNFPLVMSTVSDAWAHLPREQEDSARLLGAGEWRVFRTVTVFELMSAIVSACIPVFIYCFFSFMMILLFGGMGTSTLEVEIYQAARNTLDFRASAALSFVETALACLVVALYVHLEDKAQKDRGISVEEPSTLKNVSRGGERIFFLLMAFLVALFFLAPFFSIVLNAFTPPERAGRLGFYGLFYNFKKIFSSKSFFNAFLCTFLTAVLSSFLCVCAGFFYSVVLRKTQRFSLKVVSMLPMAVSGIVTGFGLSLLFRRGNLLLLALAQASLSWPMAFRQIFPYISKIPESTVDAARILSRSPLELVFRIYLPVCRRGIISAAGFCFAISAGDTSLPLIFSIPDFSTLSIFTYRLAGSYRFNEACAAGVVLGLLCAAVFALGKKSFKGGKS